MMVVRLELKVISRIRSGRLATVRTATRVVKPAC